MREENHQPQSICFSCAYYSHYSHYGYNDPDTDRYEEENCELKKHHRMYNAYDVREEAQGFCYGADCCDHKPR